MRGLLSTTSDVPGQSGFLGEAQRRSDRISLRYRLPLSYAAVALLTALVLGGILLALTRYYSQAEQAYLDASADRAILGLSTMDWPTLSASGTAAELLLAKERTQALALGPNCGSRSGGSMARHLDPRPRQPAVEGDRNATGEGLRLPDAEVLQADLGHLAGVECVDRLRQSLIVQIAAPDRDRQFRILYLRGRRR